MCKMQKALAKKGEWTVLIKDDDRQSFIDFRINGAEFAIPKETWEFMMSRWSLPFMGMIVEERQSKEIQWSLHRREEGTFHLAIHLSSGFPIAGMIFKGEDFLDIVEWYQTRGRAVDGEDL